MSTTTQKPMPIRTFAASIDVSWRTVETWIRRGVAGVRLATVRKGGRVYVDPRDYAAFNRMIERRKS